MTARAPEPHMSVAMDDETARALLADDDAVGTTTLTSAVIEVTAADDAELPNERGSLSVPRTWGAPSPTDHDGIPATRD